MTLLALAFYALLFLISVAAGAFRVEVLTVARHVTVLALVGLVLVIAGVFHVRRPPMVAGRR